MKTRESGDRTNCWGGGVSVLIDLLLSLNISTLQAESNGFSNSYCFAHI